MVLFVDQAAVLGAGVMGARIAEVLAMNNVKVVLRDIDQAAVDRGMATIRRDLEELVGFHAGKAQKAIDDFEQKTGVQLTDEQKAKVRETLKPTYDSARVERILQKITPATSLDAIAKAELVIEAAPESLQLKKKIFEEVAQKVPEHAVLATNTSTLPVTDIAAALPAARRGRFLGVHFFNPPTTLPLIEIIPGLETRPDVVEDVVNFLSPLRNHRYPLVPVVVKEGPGFLVNRILAPMLNEAFACYEEGVAKPRDIDMAMKYGAGMPMGPLELADMIGLDVLHHAGESIRTQHGGVVPQRPVQVIRQMVAAGRLGRKTGRGFYEYKE